MINAQIKCNIHFNVKTDFGVICDKVGSGKSFVILGLILNNKYLKDTFIIPHTDYVSYDYRNNIQCYITNKNYLTVNLLFVPHTIFNQWKEYISKNTSLNFYAIKTIRNFVKHPKFYEKFDLILVNSSKHFQMQELFHNYIISRVIYDEVDTIKITKCQK